MHVRRTILWAVVASLGVPVLARADDPALAAPLAPEAPPIPPPASPATASPATASPTMGPERPSSTTPDVPTPPPPPASDVVPAPATRDADRWVGCLPPQRTWVPREEVTPAETRERSVPVYETVRVPLHEERCVPVYREEQVPVYATREIDVFEDRQVPEYGEVPVTVYASRPVPVKLAFPNPFACDGKDVELRLWDRCERVPCGTQYEPGIVGWRTERVAVGKRAETYATGTERRQVLAGWRTEVVEVGTRDETRCVGWRTETVVVAPERRRLVHDCVDVPSRFVTVTRGEAAATLPLPGTTVVVDEATFARASQVGGR